MAAENARDVQFGRPGRCFMPRNICGIRGNTLKMSEKANKIGKIYSKKVHLSKVGIRKNFLNPDILIIGRSPKKFRLFRRKFFAL